MVVVLSLMGAGLKLGFRYTRKHWKDPLRLIHTTMPLYILGIFLLAHFGLGLGGPESLLIAAVCAPTDPVMATEMQLQDEENKNGRNTGLRYMLTAEAGLNDGLAFPFVFLAIMWSKAAGFAEVDFLRWTSYYLVYKIMAGIAIGSLIGLCYSWLLEQFPREGKKIPLSGFMGIALAITSFAVAETASAYGFLSAFFTGLFAQYHLHRDGGDHSKSEMLHYIEETEKFLIVVFILVFGGFLANGILGRTTIAGIAFAFIVIFLLRPLAGIASLVGANFGARKKWAIAFFGIKSIGSIFYLSFGLMEGNFERTDEIYAIVCWVILFSIVVHGATGPRAIEFFERNNPG